MRPTPLPRLLACLVLVPALLVACGGDDGEDSDSAAARDSAAAAAAPSAAPTPAPAPAPTDPQIAHIAVTANSIDSANGAMAKPKASAKEVKDFAQMMITDHGTVNKQAVALAKKLNVTPEDNETSRGLQSGAEQARSAMQGKSGADFDRAYIDNEVTYHQAVLDALDKTLIPNAQNAELKALLQQVRPNVAAHLERAKGIQSKLGGAQ